eukprot:5348653-Prymnesium_polylepis.3
MSGGASRLEEGGDKGPLTTAGGEANRKGMGALEDVVDRGTALRRRWRSKLGPAGGRTGAVARLRAGATEGTSGATAEGAGGVGAGGGGGAPVTAENGVYEPLAAMTLSIRETLLSSSCRGSGPCWAIQPITSESSVRSSAEARDSSACWGERRGSAEPDRWRSRSSVTMPVENTAAISLEEGPT